MYYILLNLFLIFITFIYFFTTHHFTTQDYLSLVGLLFKLFTGGSRRNRSNFLKKISFGKLLIFKEPCFFRSLLGRQLEQLVLSYLKKYNSYKNKTRVFQSLFDVTRTSLFATKNQTDCIKPNQ